MNSKKNIPTNDNNFILVVLIIIKNYNVNSNKYM